MKIAVGSAGRSTGCTVDGRFGRCRFFIIADTEKKSQPEAIENAGNIQGHGAGVKAAEQIGNLGIQAVLTGNVGPKALDILQRFGIRAYQASGNVEEAISAFADGKLDEITKSPEPVFVSKGTGERIYFPLLNNNGLDSEICPHFGHAPFFGLYDTSKKELAIAENTLDHANPEKSPIDQIEEAVHPDTIFAKGIGARAISLIGEKGIALKTGKSDTVRDAVNSLEAMEDLAQSCGHEHHT
ncbi:MAG: NifB/NifX family molybdenum-iron cluster-binding protein [archaeon]